MSAAATTKHIPIVNMSHLGICVRSLDKSLAFYRDLVGMKVVREEKQAVDGAGWEHVYRTKRKGRHIVFLRYNDDPASPILVVTEHVGEPVLGEPIMLDEIGISHLSFSVPDLDSLTQRLLAAGVKTAGPPDIFRESDGVVRSVFVFDPDGMLVQFDHYETPDIAKAEPKYDKKQD